MSRPSIADLSGSASADAARHSLEIGSSARSRRLKAHAVATGVGLVDAAERLLLCALELDAKRAAHAARTAVAAAQMAHPLVRGGQRLLWTAVAAAQALLVGRAMMVSRVMASLTKGRRADTRLSSRRARGSLVHVGWVLAALAARRPLGAVDVLVDARGRVDVRGQVLPPG